MNTDLLKTFLEVARVRHFGRAAENLFVTQSAVSARIRQFEESLGAKLFTRGRHDVRLTAAGERMLKHAESILSAWRRAAVDTVADDGNRHSLSVGAMYSLWDILIQKWVHKLYGRHPELALTLDAQSHEILLRRLLAACWTSPLCSNPYRWQSYCCGRLPPSIWSWWPAKEG